MRVFTTIKPAHPGFNICLSPCKTVLQQISRPTATRIAIPRAVSLLLASSSGPYSTSAMATTDYTGKPYTIYRGSHGKLIAATTTIPSLAPNEVLLKITHSGVCFSDLEVFRAGMPPALGHEGVGTVVAVGPAVTTLRIGDRAGGGYHRGSCGRCAYCLRGDDIWCYERRIFGEELGGGGADNGTFGEYYVGVETYVHRIPDAIASEHAAPLQCAGATVYAALMDTVGNAARVGILGIGGLGHLAVQFAAKMGKEVVVFSTSADKETEARGFGATEFYTMDEVDKITAPIEVLVVSGARYPDWSK